MNSLVEVSSYALYASFMIYLIATFFFGATIKDKTHEKNKRSQTAEKIAISLTITGFLAQIVYFITRWIASSHAPVSNMFEFVTFLGMSLVLGFIILYFIYRVSVLGLFALPVSLIIIAFASVFPSDISPLVPSLQSHWLYIHVTTVSIAQGILAISFVAGLLYLVREIKQEKRNFKNIFLEIIIITLLSGAGFFLSQTFFGLTNYQSAFMMPSEGTIVKSEYTMPALITPYNSEPSNPEKLNSFVKAPTLFNGNDAPRKLNTIVWSVMIGLILYGLAFLLTKQRLGAYLQPYVKKISANLIDEIIYRSVTIGFPLFTLGGLIFAAIWAQVAWDRFWGWDPKEIWALITWFFYAAFLHLRISKGWHGEKSAWLAVVGFGIIMFNIVVVNLVISGLHSYA